MFDIKYTTLHDVGGLRGSLTSSHEATNKKYFDYLKICV